MHIPFPVSIYEICSLTYLSIITRKKKMLKKSIFISVLIASTVAEKRLEFSIYKLCQETFCFALFDAEALKTSTNTITHSNLSVLLCLKIGRPFLTCIKYTLI